MKVNKTQNHTYFVSVLDNESFTNESDYNSLGSSVPTTY